MPFSIIKSPRRLRSVPLLILMAVILAWGPAHSTEAPGRAAPEPARALAPVLLIDGGDSPAADDWYHAFMDSLFGVGNWDLYDMPAQGLPNPPELFLSVLRQYSCVLWYSGSEGATVLANAGGVLTEYVQPDLADSPPGRLLIVTPNLYLGVGGVFAEALGISYIMDPQGKLTLPAGSTALSLGPDLPDLVASVDVIATTGLRPLAETEILHRLEYCVRCYGNVRPPFDPVVAVRTPDRAVAPFARTVTLTVPLHQMLNGRITLETLLTYHMGIVPTAALDTGAGQTRLSVNNAGYFGNFFADPDQPSLVYPYPGYVEHLYQGGLWVGARKPDGTVHVSTSSDDYSNFAAAQEIREFAPAAGDMTVISNRPASDLYDPAAVAPWEMTCAFQDDVTLESGNHTPLGVKVLWRTMSWDDYPIDDGVVLEYRIVNESGADLRDVYVGLYTDTTIGNTLVNNPYYPPDYTIPSWNWYDDKAGGWQPGDVPDDPGIWMMWEHDDDGDDGWATSWVGTRLLGSSHVMAPEAGLPPVSYNSWRFRDGPEEDDTYWDVDQEAMVPGRYQTLGNGHFDVGETPDTNFDQASDWEGLLSTGPVPTLAAGDTLRVTFALVCGDGSWDLMRNSRRFAELKANGWSLDMSPAVEDVPAGTHLAAAVPNPFNPSTEIRFSLGQPGWTRLEVLGIDGRRVAVLVDGLRAAGDHRVSWHGRNAAGRQVASGLYLYRLTAPDGSRQVGHMTLLK